MENKKTEAIVTNSNSIRQIEQMTTEEFKNTVIPFSRKL